MIAKRITTSKRPCHVTWLWDEINKKVTYCCHELPFSPSCHDPAHVALNFKTVAIKILPMLWEYLDDEFTSHIHIRCWFFSYEIIGHINLSSVWLSYAWRRPHKVFYNFQVLIGNFPLHSFSYTIRIKLGDNRLSGALRVASYAPGTCATQHHSSTIIFLPLVFWNLFLISIFLYIFRLLSYYFDSLQ